MSSVEALLARAEALESTGQLSEVIRLYTEALADLRQSRDSEEDRVERQLDLLYRRAAAHRFHGQLDNARTDFESCASLAEESNRAAWEARAQRALGEIFLRQKQIDHAVRALRRSLEISETSQESADLLMTKARLARALCDLGQMDDALETAADIVSALRTGAVLDPAVRYAILAQTYLALGVAAFKKGQGRRARRFFQRALAHLSDGQVVLPLAECRRYLGILESEAKNFLEASAALSRALEVYTQLRFDPGRFDCYLSLGITYMDMGDLHNARLCFQSAEKIARAADMRPELAKNQSRFADLEMREGKYEAARQMYEEDLRLTELTSDRQGLGYCHRNVSRACRALEDYGAAETHALKSQEYFRATGRHHLAALSHLELAECSLGQGRYDEAQQHVEAAERELVKRNTVAHEPRIQCLYGKVLMARGEPEQALIPLEASIAAHLRHPPTRELAETRYEAAVACRLVHREAEAVEHLRNAVRLSETLGCRDIREQALRLMDEIDMLDAQRIKLSPYVPSGAIDELSAEWVDIDRRKEPTVATVMFVDMRDYTSLSGKIDELELVETVEGFVSLVVRMVRQNDGTVDKFIGDCVMATFGFNQTPEQGARMALWTGLEILEQLTVISQIREDAGVRPLHGTIGINTGLVVSGCFGPLEKRDYTVVGYHVNLASRMQSLASIVDSPEPNRLVVSDATLELAPNIAAAREIKPEEYSLKGIDSSSLTAWLVMGRK